MEEIIDNNPIAQNVGNNQIFLPKNSVPAVSNNNAINNNPIENIAQDANNQLSATNGNYYNLFGMTVSKTTIYIIVLFLILIGIYIYFKNKAPKKSKESIDSKDDKKKNKKKNKKSKDENKSKTTTSEESS